MAPITSKQLICFFSLSVCLFVHLFGGRNLFCHPLIDSIILEWHLGGVREWEEELVAVLYMMFTSNYLYCPTITPWQWDGVNRCMIMIAIPDYITIHSISLPLVSPSASISSSTRLWEGFKKVSTFFLPNLFYAIVPP